MPGMKVFALANPSQFTGFEQTRVMDLITVLAFASLVIWLIILISILVRHFVIMGIAIGTKRRQQKVVKQRLEMGNGS